MTIAVIDKLLCRLNYPALRNVSVQLNRNLEK